MANSLEGIFLTALRAVDYQDSENNQRLISALQDLLKDYPKEKKILIQNADDHFFGICSKAMAGDIEQLDQVTRSASKYLQDECLIREDWADRLATAFVSAFAQYKRKDNETDAISGFENTVKSEEIETTVESEKELETISIASETAAVSTTAKPPSESVLPKGTEKKGLSGKAIGLGSCALVLILIIIIAVVGSSSPDPVLLDEEVNIGAGGERILAVEDLDEDTEVEWTSSDTSIVKVDESGMIKAKKEGSATVSLTADGSFVGECQVAVNELELTTDPIDYYPTVGEDLTLSVEGTDTTAIRWKSKNPDVFSFSAANAKEGEGHANEPGMTTIIAKVDGQTLKKKIGVWADGGEGLKVNKTKTTIDDTGTLIATYWTETHDEHVEVEWDNGDILDVEWGKTYADSSVLKLKRRGSGTATLKFYLMDDDDKRIDSVDPVIVKVTCE